VTTDSSSPPAPAHRRSLFASYAAGLFSMGQAELLTIVIPLWAILQGAEPAEIGILIGARSVLTFFLAIHGGALMDRLGTRRVMLFFAVVTGLLAAVYPLLPWIAAMTALQILIGFAGNMGWMGAQTLVAQVSGGDPGQIGVFSFYSRIGNVIAPVVMGLLWDHTGPQIAFLGVTVWSVFLYLAVSQVEDLRRATPTPETFSWRDLLPKLSDYTGSIGLLAIPAVALTLGVSFMRHATNGVEQSFFIVYLQGVGYAGTKIGLLFSIAEIVNGIASLYAGRLAKILPITWSMVGLTAVGISLLAITPLLGGSFALLALAHSARRITEGLVQPLMFSIQGRAVAPALQGSIVGLRVTNNRLASIVTPVIMGFIVQHFGVADGFVVMGGLLLTACAALAITVARVPALRRQQ
jgi:MFS family permease